MDLYGWQRNWVINYVTVVGSTGMNSGVYRTTLSAHIQPYAANLIYRFPLQTHDLKQTVEPTQSVLKAQNGPLFYLVAKSNLSKDQESTKRRQLM